MCKVFDICLQRARQIHKYTSPRCKYVEDGKWDDSVQKCIDEKCSTEEDDDIYIKGDEFQTDVLKCIEELQVWIDAESVDVNDFSLTFEGTDLPVCNKAGGNEAADSGFGGVYSLYNNSDASTLLFGEKDDDIDDDDIDDDEEDNTSASFDMNNDSSATANSVSISGFLAMVLYHTLQYAASV